MKARSARVDFKVGDGLLFDYPAANYWHVRRRWETRHVVISDVRILVDDPLSPVTLAADPWLRRSSVLITGWDLDKQAHRSFYLGSMRNRFVMTAKQLAGRCEWVVLVDGAHAAKPIPKGLVAHRGLSRPVAKAFVRGFNEVDRKKPACAVLVSPKVSLPARLAA